MDTIPVIFENGVFRPIVPVVLPEATKGQVVVSNESPPIGSNSDELYALLDERFESGFSDTAARVDEMDP